MDRGMREKCFTPGGGELIIDPAIREMVEFMVLDAVNGDLPGNFDLVLCRYLFFTYFTGGRLRQAAQRLHAALNPGGALMTGAREDLPGELEDLFSPWPGAESCFSRRI
jgi:chemotaxis protein methyltransferase CheR